MIKILLDVYEVLLLLLLLFTAVAFSLGDSSMRSEIIAWGQKKDGE
jgi:hypothetical protein